MPSLDQLDQILPPEIRAVAERSMPIPTIAQRAMKIAAVHPDFVRADIGQISKYSPDDEVLYGPPVGLPALRAAIAELWSKSFGPGAPPISTRGRGCWIGFGHCQLGSKEISSPWNSATSFDQSSCIASIVSRTSRRRRFTSMP